MKRFVLLSAIGILVISLAAPAGAVFATNGASLGEEAAVPLLSPSEGVAQTNADERKPETPAATDTQPIETPAMMPRPTVAVAATSTEPPVDIVQPTPPTLPDSPLLVTAYKATGARMHAIQLYNNTSSMQALDQYSLEYIAGDVEYEIVLPSGWVMPRSYMVLAWQGESVAADGEFMFEAADPGARLQQIGLYHAGVTPVIVKVPANYGGQLLHRYKSSAGNYTTTITFSAGAATVFGGGLYVLPGAPSLQVLEILVNPRSCTYGQETDDCYDYIKVKNDGDEPLDLSLYRLRSGYSNASSAASNTTYFSDIVAPGEVKTLTRNQDGNHLSFTANDGTVWLEDRYGYASFDPAYVGSDKAAQVGRSWAYNPATTSWQWAIPAPNREDNNVLEATEITPTTASNVGLQPCQAGYYRNPDTNRCRKIEGAVAVKPCKEGQYRSEETNRCRSIAAVASALKSCADDQFRNPLTNRCKKIASADDITLADCGEGRERNPDTNRCRNIRYTAPPAADFTVEPVVAPASVFVGWWAFGGIAALALGYAGWEWREEIGRAIRKVLPAGRSAK